MLKLKMTMEEPEIKHSLTMEQETEVYGDLGDSEIFRLAEFINSFLRAYGYSGYNSDYVFLESVSDEEYELLSQYLWELRNEGEGK